MSPTTRFIGASIARMPGSVIQQLLAMRRDILRFNEVRGLHTVLLYSAGWFVQWHEGPADAVARTWAISRSHDGHSHPRVVHHSEGPGVLAEPVQIAALSGPDRPTDIARRLLEIEREQAHDALEPVDIWRRFGAPGAGRQDLPNRCVRVLALVSEYTESVELVKALAERCRVPVNYQRFAGPQLHSGDAGAAYVDVGIAGKHTRVQALSRHVLGYSIARLSFARVDGILLLPNQRPDSAAVLGDAVAPFAAGLKPRPAFHVAAPGGRTHLEVLLDAISRSHSPASHTPGQTP